MTHSTVLLPPALSSSEEALNRLGELVRVLHRREVADIGEHHRRAAGDGSGQLGGDVEVDGLVVIGADDGDLLAVDGAQPRGRELRQRPLERADLGREVGEVGVGLDRRVLGRAPRHKLGVDGRVREGRVAVLGHHEAGEDECLADPRRDGRVLQHGQRRGRAVGPPDHVVRLDPLLVELGEDVVGEHVKGEDVVGAVCAAAVTPAVYCHDVVLVGHELLDDVGEVRAISETTVIHDNRCSTGLLVVLLQP